MTPLEQIRKADEQEKDLVDWEKAGSSRGGVVDPILKEVLEITGEGDVAALDFGYGEEENRQAVREGGRLKRLATIQKAPELQMLVEGTERGEKATLYIRRAKER